MNTAAIKPSARKLIKIPRGIHIKSDLQEICSFTLEPCLLKSGAGPQGEAEALCPFTLEPVCMRTRAASAVSE